MIADPPRDDSVVDDGRTPARLPEQPMPVARSVLWRPTADPACPETDPYPVFVGQRVIAAIADHLGSAPEQGLLGFLVGRVLRCPDTGVRYVVVENGVRVPQMIVGDASEAVVAQSLVAVQRMLRPSGGELVGWYHSHPRGDATLSDNDRAVHARYFQHPWHVALVFVIGEETQAGFFRPPGDATGPAAYLPFYELVDERADQSGWKRTIVAWSNYWSPDPALWPATAVAPGARSGNATMRRPDPPVTPRTAAPPFIPPSAFDAESDEEDDGDPATRRPAPRRGYRWVVAGSLLVAVVVLGAWLLLGPAVPTPATEPESAPTPIPLMASPEPVRRAIAAYQGRASLFANRQMTCDDLGRGLADVDAQWVQYTVARRGGAGVGDTAQQNADQALTSDVAAVEHDFERTGCPRP